jgi:hypothetical protein
MFFTLSFFCFLLQNWKTGWWSKSCLGGRDGASGKGEVLGKGVGGWTQGNKMCTYVNKCKNDTCWNYSNNLGGGMKENGWGDEFMYDIFDTL